MKKLYIFILILLMTASWPKNDKEVYAFDINATQYFNLGLESSMIYKKIDYFSKALEMNPRLAPAYEKRGLHYYFQEKYDKVIEDFTIIFNWFPIKPMPTECWVWLILKSTIMKRQLPTSTRLSIGTGNECGLWLPGGGLTAELSNERSH